MTPSIQPLLHRRNLDEDSPKPFTSVGVGEYDRGINDQRRTSQRIPNGGLVMNLSLKGTVTSLVMAALLCGSMMMNAALLRMSYQQSVNEEQSLTRQLREIVSNQHESESISKPTVQLDLDAPHALPPAKKLVRRKATKKAEKAVAEKETPLIVPVTVNAVSERETSTDTSTFSFQTESAPTCSAMSPDEVSYTLVTQASDDRVWMMGHHCRRWTQKVSTAVFTDRSHEEVMQEMIDGGCTEEQLTLQVMNSNDYEAGHYPVNTMRNMALSAVKTSHAVYMDVDFWEPADLYYTLQTKSVREAFAEDHKLAAVMPAFQMDRTCKIEKECRGKTAANVALHAETIKSRFGDNVDVFDPKNMDAHSSTDYKMWMTQPAGDLSDIQCIKSYRYEPYLVFRYCQDLPPFQESFTGYGKNKIQWIMHLRRTGYKFKQLGGSFAVHYPHKPSEARKLWEKKPKELWGKTSGASTEVAEAAAVANVDLAGTKRGQVDAIFSDFKDWLYHNVPDTSRTPLCTADAEDEPNLWINRS